MGGTVRGWSASLLVAGLVGCASAPPPINAYAGLQFGIESYYNGLAMEENASCTSPMMTAIVSASVVEETPQELVLNLRYKYRDESKSNDGILRLQCNQFASRTFTMSRQTDGSLSVTAMTGEQRSRG